MEEQTLNYRLRLIRKIIRFTPEWLLIKLINLKTKSFQYPVTLMFHHVLPASRMDSYLIEFSHDPIEVEPYSITPEKFEEILLILKELGYSFIFEDDYKKQNGKVAIITFDDGYSDNYIYALPLLKKHAIKASVNLIANNICDEENGEFLSKKRIKEMQESGLIQFQAHTLSHPELTKCSDEECRKEIVDCKNVIHKKTGIETTAFVYPCCQTNKKVADIVKQHYSMAYGGNDLEIDYIYRLPRIEMKMSLGKKDILRKMLFSYYSVEE